MDSMKALIAACREKLLAELEICDAATDGPWAYRPKEYDNWGMVRGGDMMPVADVGPTAREDVLRHPHGQYDPGPVIRANGDFIATARTGYPAVLRFMEKRLARILVVRSPARGKHWPASPDFIDSEDQREELIDIADALGVPRE